MMSKRTGQKPDSLFTIPADSSASVEEEPVITTAPLHPSEVRFAEPQPGTTPTSTRVSKRGNIVESF